MYLRPTLGRFFLKRRLLVSSQNWYRALDMFDVILDRDGVLNVDVAYTHQLEDFALAPGVVEGLTLLKSLGARLSIATGQSGIDRGKYDQAQMQAFNAKLVAELEPYGITFAAIVFCPHHPDYSGECVCRKPGTGMLEQIEAKLGTINWQASWGVGDKPSDAEMILAKDGNSILIESGKHNNTTGKSYWSADDQELAPLFANPKNFVARDILAAAKLIEANS